MAYEIFLNIFGIISAFTALLLASFLLTVKTEGAISNKFFAGFLILTAVNLSGFFLYLLIAPSSWFYPFQRALAFLQMPAFFLYFLTVCYPNYKFKKIHALHLLPFLIALWLAVFDTLKIGAVETAGHIQYYLYMIAVFFVLRKFNTIYKENYARDNSRALKWLYQLALTSLFAHTFVVAKSFSKFGYFEQALPALQIGVSLFATGVIIWFTLNALHHPELFRSVDSKLKRVQDLLSGDVGSEKDMAALKKLERHMTNEQPYHDASLTLKKLARQLSVPSRDLSIMINHHIGQHFFDFVNAHRIEEAKKLLVAATPSQMSVLDILYEVGFNSKSSFNTAFKKHTGTTPSAFRKTNT
jgi:AraC-like DNA-binding protein